MRNLFERLKPEHLKKLNEIGDLYPATKIGLISALELNNFWADLSYSNIFALISHLDLYDYSPHTIESLFEND